MAKIVFLDEYSLGDMDLTPIKKLGEYVGYDRTSKEQVLERS
jgi:glycerate dehydrogenase